MLCHSIFARSLARSSFSGPHGMSLTHAACDQPLMNSPITKLKFCHSGAKSNGAKNLKIEVLLGGVVKDNDFFLFRLAILYA